MKLKVFKLHSSATFIPLVKSVYVAWILLAVFIFQFAFIMEISAQSDNFKNRWEPVQEYYQAMADEYSVVGGALLFLEKGEVKGEVVHGLADISEDRPVKRETIFHWASITKTFTAIAVMQLYEEGLLSLEDPLTAYLPELGKIHNPYGSMHDITIRMALNHSTGLRNSTWPWGGNRDWHPFEPTTWNQLVAM